MAPNTRDTMFRRFSTYVWGIALILAIALVSFLMTPLLSGPETQLEDDYLISKNLKADVKKVHIKQAELKASYHYDPEVAAEKLYKVFQDQANGKFVNADPEEESGEKGAETSEKQSKEQPAPEQNPTN